MSGDADADLATVIELERRLLDPMVRLDRTALSQLLHPDFCEFGASGRVYDRDSIIEMLLSSDGIAAKATGFKARRLSSDAVLVTYRADATLRTSIWSRDRDGAWRVLHHQGTRAAE